MEHILNFAILNNPMNWVIIFFVLYLVALIAHLLVTSTASAPIQLPGL